LLENLSIATSSFPVDSSRSINTEQQRNPTKKQPITPKKNNGSRYGDYLSTFAIFNDSSATKTAVTTQLADAPEFCPASEIYGADYKDSVLRRCRFDFNSDKGVHPVESPHDILTIQAQTLRVASQQEDLVVQKDKDQEMETDTAASRQDEAKEVDDEIW
jgi:hypothetical protein